MKRSVIQLGLAALLTVSLALAGCGSKGGGGGGKAQDQPKYAQGVTDSEIHVGTFVPLSGPAAAYSAVAKGADAYFKYINDKGGVNGRKFKFTIIDDGYQPSRAVAAAKKLVEEDKVFAIVSSLGTPSNAAVMPYVTQKGIPVVAIASGSSQWAKPLKKNVFALQTNYEIEGQLAARYAIETLKAKKIGLFYQNDDFGKEGYNAAKAAIQKLGGTIAAEYAYNPADLDFSPAALRFKQAGVDLIIMFSIPKPTGAFVRELTKIGFKPKLLSSAVNADLTMFQLAGPGWEGTILGSWLPMPNDVNNPKVKEVIDAFQKYYPGEKISGFVFAGWANAQVFVEAVRRCGDDLTWENFIKRMESIQNWNEGLAYNVTYGPDDHQGQNALYYIQAKDGDFVKISDFMEAEE